MSDVTMLDVSRIASSSKGLSDLSVIREDQLLVYYDRLFPVEDFVKWLSYGNDSKHPAASMKYFQHRELSFTLNGNIYLRYQSFKDARSLRRALVKKCPEKIDIGPVYSIDPQHRGAHTSAGFHCEEREFVFDIDIDSYDDVRTCSSGKFMSDNDWAFMAAAIMIFEAGLRDDFGFEHILWVYSGRRGIHCWVCDKRARLLSDKARLAIVRYFTVYDGQEKGMANIKVQNTCYPAIQRALDICKNVWIYRILPMQQYFESKEHAENIFNRIPDRTCIEKAKKAKPTRDEDINQNTWRVLEKEVENKFSKSSGSKQHKNLLQALNDVVLAHVYPRLDSNVSVKMNHLLKAPFCVHPGTGRICVPIDPGKVWDFCPGDVPRVDVIVDQLNSRCNPNEDIDIESTDLFPYVQYFRQFVTSMNASNNADLTAKAKARSQNQILEW